MYAQSIVDARLDSAYDELGWRPELHSIEEIEAFQLRNIAPWERYNANGQFYFGRDLSQAEYRFITNERVMCACDAAYYLTRYAKLSDENDNTVRFRFRATQRVFFSVISELEEDQAAIELIVAKGRQVFMTTITELLIGHRIFFSQDVNALVASADRVKSEEMAKKVFFAYDQLPWWLKPKYSRRVESVPGLLEFDTINTRISVQHGSTQAKQKGQQRVGLGRGGTRTVWHVSEASAIPQPEQQIEASLLRATHPSPRVFGVVESTFAGNTGWFAENYKFAKEHRDDGLARLHPIFFNWPCARDIYPTRTDEQTHPVPSDWEPTGAVLEKIRKAELFIRTDPLLSKAVLPLDQDSKRTVLGRDYEMPREQQYFYYRGYERAKETGTLKTFLQEMANDDVESMISSYDNVFGQETIEVCHKEREKEFDVYMLAGQSIETQYEPPTDEIDYDKPRIPVRHRSPRGDVYEWEFIPLRSDVYSDPTGRSTELDAIDCRLFVYKTPAQIGSDNGYYNRPCGVGADSSTGSGEDFSVIGVTLKGSGAVPDIQVAEWRSRWVGHTEIFAFALPICLFFRDPRKDILGYPMFAIEQLASVGDVCQKEMKKLGYPSGRFFDFGRYDTHQVKKSTGKHGWFTTGWSRPILTGYFVHCVKNGWYIPNSPWLIESCRRFEVHSTGTGKERLEHSADTWDDDIFANAISSFILHDLDTMADRSKNQRRVREEDLPELNIKPYSGQSFQVPKGRPIHPSRAIDPISTQFERYLY